MALVIAAAPAVTMPAFGFGGHGHSSGSFSREGDHRGMGPRGGEFGRAPHQKDLPQYRGNPHHLGGWLQRHGDMPFADQEKALRSQEGFQHLSPEMQNRLLGRLKEIDQMPPRQRERTIDRIEAMERLSPARRQAVRTSIKAIHQLPPDRQRMVRTAFRNLRNDPPDERRKILSSPQFKQQFSKDERTMLSNVLAVEPYEPLPAPTGPPR